MTPGDVTVWLMVVTAITSAAIFLIFVVLAVNTRLRNRLSVSEMVNATGDESFNGYCATAAQRIEAQIICDLAWEKSWWHTNAALLPTIDVPSFGLIPSDDFDAGVEALARAAPSSVPPGLVESLWLVPKFFQQRGYRVSTVLQQGPPGPGHHLGLMVQVSEARGRHKAAPTESQIFWERGPVSTAPLPERVESLLDSALRWASIELTRRSLQRRRHRRWGAGAHLTPDEEHNAIGVLMMAAAPLCRDEDKLPFFTLALAEFSEVGAANAEKFCYAQFHLGETARQLARLWPPHSVQHEEWLMKARAHFDAALAHVPVDLRLGAARLRDWIVVKRTIAGLRSERAPVRAAAAAAAVELGEQFEGDRLQFLRTFDDAQLRYNAACMCALAGPVRGPGDTRLCDWAGYMLAAALIQDAACSRPALWEEALGDSDFAALGQGAVTVLEDTLTDLLDRDRRPPNFAQQDRLSAQAWQRVSHRHDPYVARALERQQ